jgi:hypothetical protein
MCEFLAGGLLRATIRLPAVVRPIWGAFCQGAAGSGGRNRRRGRRFVDPMGAKPLGERVMSTRVSLICPAHAVGRKKP